MEPDTIKRPMQIMLPEATKAWLRAKALASERSMNWLINRMLDDARKAEQHHKEQQQ